MRFEQHILHAECTSWTSSGALCYRPDTSMRMNTLRMVNGKKRKQQNGR